MNCVLTAEQQKSLFKKVYVDLSSTNLPLDINKYIEDFYDTIVSATDDKSLALSYISLLPQNIRTNIGVNKTLSTQYAENFIEVVDLENKFNSLDFVGNYIAGFKAVAPEVIDLQKDIQASSLRPLAKPVETIIEKETEKPVEPIIGLSDLTFENVSSGDLMVSPDKKLYAAIKRQLIKNTKQDGTSSLEGVGPVKLQIISTQRLEDKDMYPDVLRQLQAGSQEIKDRIIGANKEGAVIAVTDLSGNLLYFDPNGVPTTKPEGKLAYFLFRNPKPDAQGKFNLNEVDKQAVRQLAQTFNLNDTDAKKAYLKKIGAYKVIRKYINLDPTKNSLDVSLSGGYLGVPVQPDTSLKTPLSALNLSGQPFFPREGVEAKGQTTQSYYFDIKNIPVPIQIKRPDVPKELAENLASLLFDNIFIEQRGSKYPLNVNDRIKTFEQFFYTSPTTISFITDSTGGLVMRKFGEVVLANSPEEYKKILVDYLTRLQPAQELDRSKVNTRKIITDLKDASNNYVYQTNDGNKDRFFLIKPAQLEISKTAMKNNKYQAFTLTPIEGGVLYKGEEKPYSEFIKNNFAINYPLDANGNIETVNAFINYDLPIESVSKIQNKPVLDKKIEAAITPIPESSNINNTELGTPVIQKTSPKDFLAQQRKNNPNTFNKLIDQNGLEATEKQIEDAMVWYSNHPMSKEFPFEAAFSAVNLNNPQAMATWTVSGITLYKGSDFSDLYHEAWHGFTQGFLSKTDKMGLYNEAREKSGSFVDYTGAKVSFGKATDLQIEEYLAEDFRAYMLSGGKTKGGVKRNSIFRRILNFFKALFEGSTYSQIVSDDRANKTINNLYEKLRLGNLTNYSFSVENRNFNTLNKGIGAINKNEPIVSLTFENSKLLLDSINSIFAEYADANNSYLDYTQAARKAELDSKSEITLEEKAELNGLNAPQQTYKYTTKLFETPAGLKATYEYVKYRFAGIYEDIKQQNETQPSAELQNKLDLLKWSIRNFGNVEDILKNSPGEGVVGYHIVNSDYVPSVVKGDLQEDFDLNQRELSGKNYYDRGGNETSIFDLANKEIINIIKGLPHYNNKGAQTYNKLGIAELNPFKETFAHIAKTVQNLSTPQKMYEALTAEVDNYPTIQGLLNKLGPVTYQGQSLEEVNNWTRFWQTFNKYRIPLVQTTLNEVVSTDPDGNVTKRMFEITVGNAIAGFRRVGQRWENTFAQEQSNPFIKNGRTGNYLDTASVITKYPDKNSINGKEYEFLRDIGINLKDSKTVRLELEKAVKEGDIKIGGIYNNLAKLNAAGEKVKSLSKMVRKDDKLGLEGEAGANGNYGKLEKLQYRFADEDADFMVVNAAGDPQSEFSQNTSLTQILKKINEVGSYSELISLPEMGHLNMTPSEPGKPYNAFIESSIWIKSLFNLSEPGGPKYPNAQINVVNLSGLTQSVNGVNIGEGVISTDLDEYSKLIQDIHVQLLTGTPELTRHAGKKTSLGVFLNNYKTYSGKTTNFLYIDTADFAVQTGSISKGEAYGIELVTPYIISELKRINYATALLGVGSNIQQSDFNALKKATEFSKFSGVLAQDTQNKLKAVKGDVTAFFNSPESLDVRNEIETDIINYFSKQYRAVNKKLSEAEYISPSLYDSLRNKLTKDNNAGAVTDANMRSAIINSFVWNNWIQHVEETTLLYGDTALYKNEQDFFKRNTALNSTGDIIRNDEAFKVHVNLVLGKPFAMKAGVDVNHLQYNGILNTAVVADVEVGSYYFDEYKKALDEEETVIDEKYGAGKINEADAAALVAYDTYRIIRSGQGKWSKEDEDLFQRELSEETIKDVKTFAPVVKMGYFGPLETSELPLQALYKFALFPLIPSVIKGTKLEALHNKMMAEGVDCLTFKSGSKVSTITTNATSDKFYSDVESRTLATTPFTKNPIYVDYLKDQVEASDKFKGQISFFSQLRKLIDTGLMENGKAVTLEGAAKRDKFLLELNKLSNYKKQELLSELGWKIGKDGKPAGDIKPLLELVSRELKRRDFPAHTLEFIQTIKDNQVKNSLDISQFAEQIEAVIVAVINKRLINYKVKGEQLVQVAGTGFEKATTEQREKYATNDLTTYHRLADGTTAAAKVKIAIQGGFKNLLKLPEVEAKAKELGSDRLMALNTLIKEDEWLKNNRDMITMVGARIPTQGLNSMEFVEVFEFLPEQAGPIIIAPSEITAKSGADYDYDKLPMMMPHIKYIAGKVSLAREYTKPEAKEIYNSLIQFEVNKASLKNVTRKDLENFMDADKFNTFEEKMIEMLGDSYLETLVEVVKEDAKIPDFDTFYERLNGSAAIENNIIQAIKAILSEPSNFAALIRPNSTEMVEPLAKNIMAPLVTDPDVRDNKSNGTAVFEPLKNLQIHQANTTGKRTLGIGAVENTYNSIFNGIGMHLNPYFTKGRGSTQYRATVLLPHNTIEVEGGKVISLSNLADVFREVNISDIISQLINGWVDVEKDDWVSYIQGNEEVSPILLFLVEAGVPFKDAVFFVSQPLVRKYVTEQRLSKSSFAAVLGKKPQIPSFARIEARNRILLNTSYGFQIGEKLSDRNIYEATLKETSGVKEFSTQGLLGNLKKYSEESNKGTTFKPVALDRQTFLHYLEVENMVKQLQALKLATNVDTRPDATLYEMSVKRKAIDQTSVNNLFPSTMIDKIKSVSAIGPYFIQEFANDVFGKLFPLRNKDLVNEFLQENTFDPKLFKSEEAYVRTFKNDLISYIFQNGARAFELSTLVSYLNNGVEFEVNPVEEFGFGAVVKEDKLLVNKNTLTYQYESREFSREGYGQNKLAILNENTFATQQEYNHFVLERETLRSMYNLSYTKDQFDYKTTLAKNYRKDGLRKEGQTEEEFLSEVEKISYEEWLKNKALYNILNPWIMFKSSNSVADRFMAIVDKYPQMKDNYSLLKGVQYSSGELGYRNLKLAGDKIDSGTSEIYNENLRDLSNNSIIKVEDTNDNKYISDFFKNFSTWMFMQAGQNNNNPFSFNKVLLQEDIVRLVEGPYKKVLGSIDKTYLNKFNDAFTKQNANKLTRLRGKNYLVKSMVETVSLEQLNTDNNFRGYPVKSVTKTVSGAAASNLTKEGVIEYVPSLLLQKYQEKAWTKPRILKDGSSATPLYEDTFKSLEEWLTFVFLHELAHNDIKQYPGETKGVYEDRINREALNSLYPDLKDMQPNTEELRTTLQNKEEIINFKEEKTRYELQEIIQGYGQVSQGRAIQAATQYLKRTKSTSALVTTGGEKTEETNRLKKYVTEKNLWIPKIDLKPYVTQGAEQKVYISDDGKYVIKTNDVIFYSSWEDYLNNLLLHNYFFPATAYELIGFNEDNGVVSSVVKQLLVKPTDITDLKNVEDFLNYNGFTKNNPNKQDYRNDELGLILEDLHDENVLTKNELLYFIDTVFYITPDFYKPAQLPQEEVNKKIVISDDELNNLLSQCYK